MLQTFNRCQTSDVDHAENCAFRPVPSYRYANNKKQGADLPDAGCRCRQDKAVLTACVMISQPP